MKVKFELPENLKDAPDAGALEKVGQAILDAIAKTNEASTESVDNRIDDKLKGLRENGATKEAVEALEKALKTQGSAITELKERGVPAGKGNDFHEQLKSFMATEDFKNAMNSGKSMTFEFKADPTTITATNFASAQPWVLAHEVEPGIGVAPKEANVIFPLLNKGTTNSRDIYWVNRGPVNGDANFIGEGALKPLVDWVYNNATSNAKKVAAATKVSTEMLDDFPYMQAEIREVLNDVVMTHTDAELLNGAGTGDDLKGILIGASAYLGTDLDGTVPFANVIDAIRAIVLQMRTLNQRPNVVILNPTDKAAVDLLKNENGNYISADALAIIRALTIVETTEIEAGKVVLLDTSKFKVRPYKGISITFGWENDDFRKNLVTVICEMRLHSYHNSIDDTAIVYETISTITATLNKADA